MNTQLTGTHTLTLTLGLIFPPTAQKSEFTLAGRSSIWWLDIGEKPEFREVQQFGDELVTSLGYCPRNLDLLTSTTAAKRLSIFDMRMKREFDLVARLKMHLRSISLTPHAVSHTPKTQTQQQLKMSQYLTRALCSHMCGLMSTRSPLPDKMRSLRILTFDQSPDQKLDDRTLDFLTLVVC